MWRYRSCHRCQVCLLNCTKICWCVIETSAGLPRNSSAIFGHLRTFLEIFGKCARTFVWPGNNFEKSSGIFGKWLEIFGKWSKTPSSVCLYNKKNLIRKYEFYIPVARTISHEWAPANEQEHKIHIFSPPCNISFLKLQITLKLFLDMVSTPSADKFTMGVA